ncbi:MAG: dTDP-4-dehydrorhamnose reductase [Firmicutes bacterium]|nr:dTDP-4-dehydrorhamnose reductase [Bacillota bacterium]
MRVLVTGVMGQLGHDVVRHLSEHGIEHKGVDREDFDLGDAEAVMRAVQDYCPTVIVHCAAYTAVDRAESDMEACFRVNAQGTANMVRAALSVDAALVYISTDYVFGGEGEEAFETEDAKNPKNIYGLSKFQGELAVCHQMTKYFIVRTSWVYGVHGNNFVKTMLRLGSSRPQVNVVCDQIGSPTYSWDLAALVCRMIRTKKYGIYHATNEEFCSWAEFAAAIMEKAHLNCRVNPIPTSEYPTPAHRPCNSRLSKKSLDAAGFSRLPSWEDALDRYLRELSLEGMI